MANLKKCELPGCEIEFDLDQSKATRRYCCDNHRANHNWQKYKNGQQKKPKKELEEQVTGRLLPNEIPTFKKLCTNCIHQTEMWGTKVCGISMALHCKAGMIPEPYHWKGK